ncbi:hypothetical protein AVEN_230429-1 [Araneus ventricosus]|uniref:Uncharacterized protein n=1 Tax=Araneus ventricosus TaxID=182803 RepID=A0A4Y2U1U8_ARAVE|nr:hypothetical protein AVEN_230429-1 [Araneus ventricosus]
MFPQPVCLLSFSRLREQTIVYRKQPLEELRQASDQPSPTVAKHYIALKETTHNGRKRNGSFLKMCKSAAQKGLHVDLRQYGTDPFHFRIHFFKGASMASTKTEKPLPLVLKPEGVVSSKLSRILSQKGAVSLPPAWIKKIRTYCNPESNDYQKVPIVDYSDCKIFT